MVISVKPSDANPTVQTCPSFSVDADTHPSLVYPSSSSPITEVCQVFCGGTGNVPLDSAFINSFASVSSPTIFLSYVFGVYADKQRNALCVQHAERDNRDEQDMLAEYHKDVLFGGSNSGLVDIAPCNSLIGRLTALIDFLERTRPPAEQWSRFLYDDGDNDHDMDDVSLSSLGLSFKRLKLHLFAFSGYSQGSGHVCYLAKHHKLAAATFISGPQELVSMTKDNNVDSWLRGSYKTQHLLAFKHLNEEGTDDLIYENWQLIGPLRISADGCVKITTLLRAAYLASDQDGVNEALKMLNRVSFSNTNKQRKGMHSSIIVPGTASSTTDPFIVTFTDVDIAGNEGNDKEDGSGSVFRCIRSGEHLLEQSRCFIGMEIPQEIFRKEVPPPARPNHCSTVLDSATPLNDENRAVYAYSIWPLLSQLAVECGENQSPVKQQVSKI